jgi:hypothetical protein
VDGEGRVCSQDLVLAQHTRVTSYEHYVRTMRLPTSVGDDICIIQRLSVECDAA